MQILKTINLAFLIGALLSILAVPSMAAEIPANNGKNVLTNITEECWPDGKLQRKTEVLPNDRKSVIYFDHDGQTMLLKQEFRKDGTLAYQRHRLLDGSTLAIRYKSSGDKQMERTYDQKTGAFSLKHYRVGKSQAVWFQSIMNLNKDEATWQYFAKDGTTVKRFIKGDDMTVTVTDDKNTVKYTQDWKNINGKWTLQSVVDPATAKRFKFTADATGKLTQNAVDYLNSDGSLHHSDPTSKLQPPAAWLDEYDSDDDPTVPE